MNTPHIIFQDDDILVLYKPATWYVHPPENPIYRRGLKRRTCVQWLKDYHQLRAFPAHRIDYSTQGIVIFGKTKEAVSALNTQFRENKVNKKYYAVIRGWPRKNEDKLELQLELDSTGALVDCQTSYKVLAQIEHAVKISKKFDTSRYSLIEAKPHTGRWHQIRRHMNRIAHPIIGDREHGDSHHNRYYRDQLNIDGLCLWAFEIEFIHPGTNLLTKFSSPIPEKWNDIFKLFSYSKSI